MYQNASTSRILDTSPQGLISSILYLQITLIACFSSFDGTSLRQCREYNSDYAWVTFYANIAGAIGPFVASLTIKDAPEGSGGNFNKVRLEAREPGGFLSLELESKVVNIRKITKITSDTQRSDPLGIKSPI